MTTIDIEAKTRELYHLLTADFMKVVTDWLSDDFVWINHLPDHIPFGGVYEGAEGLGRYGQELAGAIEMQPLHIDELVVQGSSAVVIGTERGTNVIPTGKQYDMDYVHVVKFNPDGKLTYVREYNQYEGMAAAFRSD
jgi:ketosteroid isomerase-like protein